MAVVLAIDAGTTGVRTVAVDERGQPGAYAYREFTQHFPRPGWVEHDPLDIWRAVTDTLSEVVVALDGRPIAAIGITNQRETTVVWDRVTGAPAHRAPLRRAAGRGLRAARARPDRPRARPVLLGDEARVAPHRGRRRALRQPRVRHRRLVDPLEPHRRRRRRRARHRTVERESHAALRHRRADVVAGTARALRRSRLEPARRAAVEWSLRH